jgi:predicted phage tail protein
VLVVVGMTIVMGMIAMMITSAQADHSRQDPDAQSSTYHGELGGKMTGRLKPL